MYVNLQENDIETDEWQNATCYNCMGTVSVVFAIKNNKKIDLQVNDNETILKIT